MRHRPYVPAAIAVAVLALAGCATPAEQAAERERDQAQLAETLAGYQPGETRSCISNTSLPGGPQIYGQTLLYRDGSRFWRTEVIGPCPSLQGDPIVITEVYGGQLCRNDRFRLLQRGTRIPSAYCRLGNFTEYRKP